MRAILTVLIFCAFCATGQTRSKMNSTKNRSGTLTGWATYYTAASCKREGTSGIWTASGARYDESGMTCALPLHPKKWGGKYRITNPRTKLSTIVTQTDYGPGRSARDRGVVIDLTPAAFRALGGRLKDGKMKVKVEKI